MIFIYGFYDIDAVKCLTEVKLSPLIVYHKKKEITLAICENPCFIFFSKLNYVNSIVIDRTGIYLRKVVIALDFEL